MFKRQKQRSLTLNKSIMKSIVLKYFGEENTITINDTLKVIEYWKSILIDELPIYEDSLGRKGVLQILSSFNYLLNQMQKLTLCGNTEFEVKNLI